MTIKDRYEHIQERVERAASRAGRPTSDVTLVAVSKTFPASVVALHHAAGHIDFGENKIQELNAKQEALASTDVRWHFIGHLQRNKARFLTRGVHLFHALDSLRLAGELDKRLESDGETLDCLVQVNVSGEESKFGVEPTDARKLLADIASFQRIRVHGFMTLAAPTPDPERVRPQFARLRRLAEEHADLMASDSPLLSMGMSGDFEVAVEEGATHIRIGSLLFGDRT